MESIDEKETVLIYVGFVPHYYDLLLSFIFRQVSTKNLKENAYGI